MTFGFALSFPRQVARIAGVWTPANLGASLALWLDAEDAASITLNGSNVSQWSDKSGNNNNAAQTTAADQPTYKATDAVLGGKPSVGASTYSGTIGLLTPSLTAQSWFIVGAYGTGVETLFPGNLSYPTLLSGPLANGLQRAGMGTTGSPNWFSSAWAPYPFVNGAGTVSTTALPMPMSILNFTGDSAVTQIWGIGCSFPSPNRSWNGPLGEIVAVPGILSTDDRQKLEGYLAWKWGLAENLPYDHPYRWDGTLFGGPKLWRPDELGASLALWFDAEDTASITLNGSTVSQWDDKSSNARHATQPTAASQPTYSATGFNGKPALTWDGTDDAMNLSMSLPVTDLNLFAVLDPNVVAQSDYILDIASVRRVFATSGQIFSGTWDPAVAPITTGGQRIYGFTTGPTNQIVYSDGTAVSTLAAIPAALVDGAVGLGNRHTSGGTFAFAGDMSEFVFVSGTLSDTDRQRIEGYLAWKWGGV